MHPLTISSLLGLLILCLNGVLILCNNPLESKPRFQLEDLLFDPENISENFVRTQNGWSYGEKLKNEKVAVIPGYMKEFTGEMLSCPASRSCNAGRVDVDELAERVFIIQSEIPELSVDISWYKVCAFSISIIDVKSSFMNHCKSSGASLLISRPVNKLLEQSIIRLCRNLPQYSTCNGVDWTLDSLTEELLASTMPHLLPMAKKTLTFTHFCFVSSRSIRARTKYEYLDVCHTSLLLLLNLREMSGSQITPSTVDNICKSTWLYNTECNGFNNKKYISDLAFEFFVLIRKGGIPNVDMNNICQFLTKIHPTLKVTTSAKTPIITEKKYLSECVMHLTPLIEHERFNNYESNKYGSFERFYSRGDIVNYFHEIATIICTSISIYAKKDKKIFIPGSKKKKVVERKLDEPILELFMNLMYSVKATSRRILGWTIELPIPGSDESKAMLMLGYSLNTVDVGSVQNPQYIRMLAILNSKRFILPETAYNIWRDSVLSIGVEILPHFTQNLTPGIIARSEKDIVNLKLNCGNNNEDVNALALELLSVAHENNLTTLKFYQFCKPSEALVGVRSQDFYSSCLEELKYIQELDSQTERPTGRYITIPFNKISKLCKDTPRWESTSSGLSYASLIVQDNLNKKDEINKVIKPYSKSNMLTDKDIYSYVIKTAARSALERSAASEQICKQFKPMYSEEDVDYPSNTQFDLDDVQHTANTLFRKAVSLLDEDKQLALSLSGNTVKGNSKITFESFCSLVLALSKVEKKYFNSECARNLKLMFRQKVIVNGKVQLATIKSRTVTKICMSSPHFEKCGNNSSGDIDEISYDLLLAAQKLRFTSITYRHFCSVVKNIRRGEIKGFIPKGHTSNANISSFFNSDCIYGLRTLSIGARHAEIICSSTRFWVMCGNYMDSEVDALASQLYSEVVQNTGLARFITVSLFELVDFCPIAEALIREVDVRFFNRECVNALAAMSISKDYGKSICQSSRHWQGTCMGTIDDHSSIIEQIDPIAGALYKSSQDLGYLDALFVDFCYPAKDIYSIKEVTETGKVLVGHETSMFHTDCPKIVSSMLHSLSEEHSLGTNRIRTDIRKLKSISSENFGRAELICQNFFNYYDPNYGASQIEEYEDIDFRRKAIGESRVRSLDGGEDKDLFLQGKSYNQRMAGGSSMHYRYNWANLLGKKFFIPGGRAGNEFPEDTNEQVNRAGFKNLQYITYGDR